jgi:hypothetical protein
LNPPQAVYDLIDLIRTIRLLGQDYTIDKDTYHRYIIRPEFVLQAKLVAFGHDRPACLEGVRKLAQISITD